MNSCTMSRMCGTTKVHKVWTEGGSEEFQTLIIRDNF